MLVWIRIYVAVSRQAVFSVHLCMYRRLVCSPSVSLVEKLKSVLSSTICHILFDSQSPCTSWCTSVHVETAQCSVSKRLLCLGKRCLSGKPASLGLLWGQHVVFVLSAKKEGVVEVNGPLLTWYSMNLRVFTPHPCNTLTLCFLKQTTSHIAGEPGPEEEFPFYTGMKSGTVFHLEVGNWAFPSNALLQELKPFSSIWKVACSPLLVFLPFIFLHFCSVRKKK